MPRAVKKRNCRRKKMVEENKGVNEAKPESAQKSEISKRHRRHARDLFDTESVDEQRKVIETMANIIEEDDQELIDKYALDSSSSSSQSSVGSAWTISSESSQDSSQLDPDILLMKDRVKEIFQKLHENKLMMESEPEVTIKQLRREQEVTQLKQKIAGAQESLYKAMSLNNNLFVKTTSIQQMREQIEDLSLKLEQAEWVLSRTIDDEWVERKRMLVMQKIDLLEELLLL